jgi:hypothetical protein
MKEPGSPRKVCLGGVSKPQVYPFQETPECYTSVSTSARVSKLQVSTQWEKVKQRGRYELAEGKVELRPQTLDFVYGVAALRRYHEHNRSARSVSSGFRRIFSPSGIGDRALPVMPGIHAFVSSSPTTRGPTCLLPTCLAPESGHVSATESKRPGVSDRLLPSPTRRKGLTLPAVQQT